MPVETNSDLRAQLKQTLQGRVCFVGVGNPDYGDDGFGVRLAEELLTAGLLDVIVCGNSPERWVGSVANMEFDHLVFLDAVELGAAAGSAVFLDGAQIEAKYPQISTHKISLGMLSRFVESNGVTKAWLLGVQPESLQEGQALSPAVRKTLGVLLDLLFQLKTNEVPVC